MSEKRGAFRCKARYRNVCKYCLELFDASRKTRQVCDSPKCQREKQTEERRRAYERKKAAKQ